PAMIRTLGGVALKRLGRGKVLWIGALFAALPVVYARAVKGYQTASSPDNLFSLSLLLLAVLPAMFVGSSVGEDIEDRTSTYLWSRPIARWTVLAGKLVALTPIVIALCVGGWVAGIEVATGSAPPLTASLGLAAGCVASSLVVTGIAVVVPRHGMALTVGYMLADLFVGAMPFSVQQLSITRQTSALAGFASDAPGIAASVIWMLVVAGIWTAIGLLRIRRLEV
ncbi:MAG TPA: hypothetical protein VF469_35840, partial [Kofleriaceae bacterium]